MFGVCLFSICVAQDLMVGYFEGWGSGVTFTDAAKEGYNVIVLAFAQVNGIKTKLHADWGAYGAAKMKQEIDDAKKSTDLKYVLMSFGGASNTFAPKGADADQLAKSLVDFSRNHGADGIDFDLEDIHSSMKGSADEDNIYLAEIIVSIRKIDKSFVIASAPQFNLLDDGSTVDFVNTGTQRIYKKSVQDCGFDFIFVQLYNTGHYCMNAAGGGFKCGNGGASKTCLSQYHPYFPVHAFARLENIVPDNCHTKIVVGEPAQIDAAGAATVYRGAHKDSAYEMLREAYTAISKKSKFGGVMVWSIHKDAKVQYKFVKSVHPKLLTGKAADTSKLVCDEAGADNAAPDPAPASATPGRVPPSDNPAGQSSSKLWIGLGVAFLVILAVVSIIIFWYYKSKVTAASPQHIGEPKRQGRTHGQHRSHPRR